MNEFLLIYETRAWDMPDKWLTIVASYSTFYEANDAYEERKNDLNYRGLVLAQVMRKGDY